MTGNSTGDRDFDSLLQSYIKGSVLVDEVLAHKAFTVQLNKQCRSRDFKIFGGHYGVEDLEQDSKVRAWRFLERRRSLEEALSATELFCVLFFIVRNQYFSKIRQQKKAANHGWMRSDSSIDELEIAAPKARDDETKYLRPFLKFTKRYDKKRRRVFKLWLKNTSYRTIAEKLGISHGTARNWVERVITEFRGSLDIASPKPPIRKARKQRTLGKKPSTSSIGRPPLKGAGDEHN